MSYLVDSNVLLRLVNRNHPMYSTSQQAYTILRQMGEELCIVPQNLVEFWAVATRPVSANGFGLSITETRHESLILKKLFHLKPETPAIFSEWEKLVAQYQVQGKQVHDTRLVAAMLVHGLTHLLTFNIKDFQRFPEITVTSPETVILTDLSEE